MGIPAEKIAEVRDRIDIVRVVGRSVQLSRKGKRHVGLCPFHREKTPSFGVDAEKKLFHCFGCQAGGDVFDFVMRLEGIEFRDAVRLLAKDANVEIADREEDARERDARESREQLFRVNAIAHSFFEKALRENPKALAYLREERGLDPSMIDRFQLGWAPEEWSALADHLGRKRLDPKHGVTLGLLGARARDGSAYDRLRGRVIFPIALPGGDIAGFGARRADWIEKDAPKYLNSPESPIYDKSSILYGLALAKDEIRKRRRAVLVEGYLDVIALHQAGIVEAVAACGTALSPRHAALLKRLAGEVVTMYDGDPAGDEATRRAAEILLREGAVVRVVALPPGEDPDTFARRQGGEAVKGLIDGAPSALDFFVAKARHAYKGGGIAGMTKAVEAVKPLLIALQDPLERDLSIAAAAKSFGLEPGLLRRHLGGGAQRPLASEIERRRAHSSAPTPGAPPRPSTTPPVFEMAILKMFSEAPDQVLAELEAKEAVRAFSHPAVQAAIDAGAEALRTGMPFDAPRALEAARASGALDETTLGTLRRTLMESLPERDDLTLCVKRLLRNRNDITLQHLRQRLAKETDPEAAAQLMREADRLNRIMASLT